MAPDLLLKLAVNRLPGHQGRKKRHFSDSCRDEGDLRAASAAYMASMGRRAPEEAVTADGLLRTAEADLRRMTASGIRVSFLGADGYPPMLERIFDPPFALFRRGEALFDEKPAVAVVGTRRPTMPAHRQSFRVALGFAAAGYPVVSGLAFGIDRSAHEGALAGRGATWAVLAGGLDRPSPFANRPLAYRILDAGGALLGEMPPGSFPVKYAFPRRNRILSGLCRGCVVIQAPERSGALITADFALEQNRDLYVASSGIEGPFSEGTRRLEAQGAPVVEDAADVMGDWGRFLDVRMVRELGEPESPGDLVARMRSELNGRLHRYMGGSFEYRGA